MSTWEPPATPSPSLRDATADRGGAATSLDALLDVTLPVAIEIGRAQLTVQEVLQLANGSVIELDRLVGEPVDIFVSDRKLAQGEVVVVGDHFGVRITRVLGGTNGEVAA